MNIVSFIRKFFFPNDDTEPVLFWGREGRSFGVIINQNYILVNECLLLYELSKRKRAYSLFSESSIEFLLQINQNEKHFSPQANKSI